MLHSPPRSLSPCEWTALALLKCLRLAVSSTTSDFMQEDTRVVGFSPGNEPAKSFGKWQTGDAVALSAVIAYWTWGWGGGCWRLGDKERISQGSGYSLALLFNIFNSSLTWSILSPYFSFWSPSWAQALFFSGSFCLSHFPLAKAWRSGTHTQTPSVTRTGCARGHFGSQDASQTLGPTKSVHP